MIFDDLAKKRKEFAKVSGVSITERRGLYRVKLSAKITRDKAIDKTYKELQDVLILVAGYLGKKAGLAKELDTLSYKRGLDAAEAYRLLDNTDLNVSLVEIVRDYVDEITKKQSGISIVLNDAMNVYLDKKSSEVSAGTYATYRAYVIALRDLFGDWLVSQVGKDEIEDLLEKHLFGKAKATYNKYLSFYKTFFGWCLENQYSVSNPCETIDRYTVDLETPSVLDVEQVELVLRCLKDHKMDALLLGFSVQLFAGLRRSEVMRVTWGCINDDYIKLEKKHTKTKRGRAIPLHKNLKNYLKTFPQFLNSNAKNELLLGINHDKWDTYKDQLLRHLDWKTMPRNVLRHSYVSYRLGILKDVNVTAYECGHSAAVLLEHHNGITSENQSKLYFKLKI